MRIRQKLTGIITAPALVYEDVRDSGRTTSNWLVPLTLIIIVSIAMLQVEMANPVLVTRTEELYGPKIHFAVEQAVTEGKFTREDANAMYALLRPGSPVFDILQSFALAIWQSAALFALGLLYWLVGKSAMGGVVPYMKVVEVVGLALVIDMLDVVARTILAVATGSLFVTPGPSLLVTHLDPENRFHLFLTTVNVFTFWKFWILGVGLSALYERDMLKVLVLIVAIWVLWSILSFFGPVVAAP